MSRTSAAGVVGGLAGVVLAGAAVGLAAERYAVGRSRLVADPQAGEQFFTAVADRELQVLASDGVALHVEEVGPARARLTMVFCHGYTQELAVWHYQRQALAADNPGKLVFWDQRSHGRSGRSSAAGSTIEQLGEDLFAVLTATAPTGPVVLVGHSMGGMTIMALADQHPELFGDRVTAVALISTSTGKLSEVTFGLPGLFSPVSRHLVPLLGRGMARRPALFERGRRLGSDLAFVLSRRAAFGTGDVSPALVEFVEQMTARTPVAVIAEFVDTFLSHDKLAALALLGQAPTLVLAGEHDLITPVSHARAMAAELPTARLVVVPGAGHMVQLEQPALVIAELRQLLRRSVRRAEPTPA